MKNIINLVVEEELHGKRIDVVIAKKNVSFSRTRIKKLIINGNLSVNDKIVNDPSKKIFKDDKVFLTIPLPKKASLKPLKYKLDIIYNDEDLLVINKSAGISMHPGAGNYDNIINALLLNLIYFSLSVIIFYFSFYGARKKGTLVNMGE